MSWNYILWIEKYDNGNIRIFQKIRDTQLLIEEVYIRNTLCPNYRKYLVINATTYFITIDSFPPARFEILRMLSHMDMKPSLSTVNPKKDPKEKSAASQAWNHCWVQQVQGYETIMKYSKSKKKMLCNGGGGGKAQDMYSNEFNLENRRVNARRANTKQRDITFVGIFTKFFRGSTKGSSVLRCRYLCSWWNIQYRYHILTLEVGVEGYGTSVVWVGFCGKGSEKKASVAIRMLALMAGTFL